MSAKATYDTRWTAIVREWLEDANVPTKLIDKDLAQCQSMQDTAEQLVEDVADWDHDADLAAEQRDIDRQIDEARWK